MEWIQTIQSALDYIEDNLYSEIEYHQIAEHVAMSSFYFHRTFKLISGMSTTEYIRNRRLSQAGQRVVLTKDSILTIALDSGYDTPESFTKAFTRFHHVSPHQARLKKLPLKTFAPLVVTIRLEGGNGMDYRIEALNKRTFKVYARRFNVVEEDENNVEIPQFWDELIKSGKLSLLEQGKKESFGICRTLEDEAKQFEYAVGVEVGGDFEKTDSDQHLWTIEAETYIVFQCKGNDASGVGAAWKHFVSEFLPTSEYEMCDAPDFEKYSQEDAKDVFCELWIPIRKKS